MLRGNRITGQNLSQEFQAFATARFRPPYTCRMVKGVIMRKYVLKRGKAQGDMAWDAMPYIKWLQVAPVLSL